MDMQIIPAIVWLLLVGKQNNTITLEESLETSYKAKYSLTIQYTPRYLSNWSENLRSHKSMHTNGGSSFIYNFSK